MPGCKVEFCPLYYLTYNSLNKVVPIPLYLLSNVYKEGIEHNYL